MTARLRPRTVFACLAVFAMAACNGIWGIHDGTLLPPDGSQAGQPAGEPGGAPPDSAGAAPGHGGEAGDATAGVGGAAGGAGGDGGEGGDLSIGGVSGTATGGGGSGGVSGSGGTAGSMSGTGGGGTGPSCSGCKLNEKKTENRACGRCGTGTQTHTATCDANCTWGPWSAWTTCSQCDTKNYRCCGAGKWEWCYDSDCAWTNDCAACSASSCPEC